MSFQADEDSVAAGPAGGGEERNFVPEPFMPDSLPDIEEYDASPDTFPSDLLPPDTTRAERKPFLDDILSASSTDSIAYDPRNRIFYIYEKGDVNYQDKNLKGDYMMVRIQDKIITAYGRSDTLADGTVARTRAQFTQGAAEPYEIDTLRYNLGTGIGNMKGLYTKEGEGFLSGTVVKKMPDNTINIADGMYTTCDEEDPHFYIDLTRAKVIPNKKVITGPAFLVLEDVPIYFLGLPFGFFPLSTGRTSGFIMPTYGEEVMKGFFIRNGGYYFTFQDYADLALTAGVYTYGSWEANAAARYVKRYKFTGGLNIRFTKDIMGERGSADYVNQNNFQVKWNHSQDARARPGSTFSASVNFSTSGYSKYGSQTMNDYLNTQTNSSVAYSKTFTGTPISFSTNVQHSQNSRDTTISLSFPNFVLNVSKFAPFKRKDAMGKPRWYEKITLSYTGTLANRVDNLKEYDLFTDKMYKNMKNGVNHVIPISTSINLLQYINISPSANYRERWYFQKVYQKWDPDLERAVTGDTTRGFYRVYDYSFSAGMSTKFYITYGPRGKLQPDGKRHETYPQIRHVVTPSVSFGYTPDFSTSKYGYYETVQNNVSGGTMKYSPYAGGMYGVPGASQSAVMSFSLQQSVMMKVKSDRDTSGVRKLTIIDNLSASSSYNFLLDSLNLAPFNIAFRANVTQNIGINLSAILDPYQINEAGQKINQFMIKKGKLGRITSVSTSFGYTFRSSNSSQPAMNDITSAGKFDASQADFFAQPGFSELSAAEQRLVMTSKYYDFNIPWNFGFNYSFSYSKPGHISTISQTLGFNLSFSLTEKWGFTVNNAGYDFTTKKITPFMVNMTRNLHCWQMTFSWVPIGFRKSWSFSIGVQSSLLKDLKYDRNSSFYDNLYDF